MKSLNTTMAIFAVCGGVLLAEHQLSSADRKYLTEVHHSNVMEVEVGQKVAAKAQNDQVKQYGQMLVDDHTKANQDVEALMQQKGITPPTAPPAKKTSKLDALSGDAFDKAFLAEAVKHHQKDVAATEKASQSGSDPDVKALAAKLLPTLKEHLQKAQDLQSGSKAPTASDRR